MLFSRSTWLVAWRGMQRHRQANAVMITTLAVLIAVLIALLSLGHNLLVAPWTYDSDRFGVLRHGVAGASAERYGFAPDEYRALRDSGLFEAISASQGIAVAQGDGSGAARSLQLIRTTPAAAEVSGVLPLLGRFVRQGEHGDERRIVISHSLWQSEFGGRQEALGQTLLLDGVPFEIVGVMPARFYFLGGDMWAAHTADPDGDSSLERRLVVNFKTRAHTDFDELASRLETLQAALPGHADRDRYPLGWRMTPLRVIDAVTGPQRPALLLILAGAASLLLLGILNVAALLVSRQIADAGALATRKALGESTAHGFAVAFAESLMVAALAAAAAAVLGRLLFDGFVRLVSVEWVPRELEGAFHYSTPALWTLPAVVLLIALCLSAIRVPGLLRIDPRAVMGGAVRSGGRRGDIGALRWLSGVQIAIAATILVSSLAIGTGAKALISRDHGFDIASTQHAVLSFPRERYASGEQRIAAMDRIAEALREGGAQASGFTDAAPMQRYTRSGVLSAAQGVVLEGPLEIDHHVAHGELAQALGLRLREGRLLDSAIDRGDSEPVAMITRSLSERLVPGGSALGLTIHAAGAGEPIARRVVGIVDDVRHESPLASMRPKLYVPFAQDTASLTGAGGQIALLTRWPDVKSMPTAERLSELLGIVDPWIALRAPTSMESRTQRSVAGVTLARQLFGGFTVLGMLLAMLGIAALAELWVNRHRHELAVRSAVGAAPRQLLGSILCASLRIAVPAACGGAMLAWLLVDTLQALLQGSASLQIVHLLAAPAVLLACALAATLLPAIKATRVQPLALLRGRTDP